MVTCPALIRSVTALLVASLVTAVTAVSPVVSQAGPGGPPVPAGSRGSVVYAPPVHPTELRRRFEAPASTWGPGHRGVDLSAPPGTSVRAPADGVVTFSGRVVDREVLTLTHPDGLRSSFEPVEDGLSAGTSVRRGAVVAVVARSSHCGPPGCLHWGVRRGEHYLDPLTLLMNPGPVVLLPDG